MKVFVVQGDALTEQMFSQNGYTLVLSAPKADIICFTGGEDVSPSLYNEPAHTYTYSNLARDEYERSIFENSRDKFHVGICRGSQLLTVLNGGKLNQHINNHTRSHFIIDVRTKEVFWSTSTHHQSHRPGPEAEIIATAFDGGLPHLSGWKEYYKNYSFVRENSEVDHEISFYPATRSLCVQGHPEYMDKNDPFVEYFFYLIKEKML